MVKLLYCSTYYNLQTLADVYFADKLLPGHDISLELEISYPGELMERVIEHPDSNIIVIHACKITELPRKIELIRKISDAHLVAETTLNADFVRELKQYFDYHVTQLVTGNTVEHLLSHFGFIPNVIPLQPQKPVPYPRGWRREQESD